ncbi:unnamed protein product [Aphanomyces euteiches]
MASPESWLQDLQLLIATDNQLTNELANVCELLGEEPAPIVSDFDGSFVSKANKGHSTSRDKTTCATANNSGKTKTQRFYLRQRDEIQTLRQEIEHLTATLNAHGGSRTTSSAIQVWKQIAKTERAGKHKVLEENKHLRDAVCQIGTFIEQMQRVFRKKPRLGTHIDIYSEEWKVYKLAAQTSLREAAIHAIADRQYHRMQSAMVKAGVIDLDNFLFQVKAYPQSDASYLLEIIHHVDVDAPFRLVGAEAWNVFEGDLPLDLPEGATESYTHVDPYTVYCTFQQERHGLAWHSNMIRKYYVEPDREVIVSRTVLEDATVPHMTKGAVENRCLCILWPKEDSPFVSGDVDVVEHSMKRICSGLYVNRPGKFPELAQIDVSHLPYPNMVAFVDRGCQFLQLLRGNVNKAIEKFHEPLAQS